MERCAQYRLAAHKLAVREARLRVREFGELPERTAEDAELVVSELVANALLHARLEPGDPIDLTIERHGNRLLIAVDDHGSFSGRPRGRGGVGFRVLDALCEDWQARSGLVRASLRIPRAHDESTPPPAPAVAPAAAAAGPATTAKPSRRRRWLGHA
jgi:two-component sensor histidine kinase